MHVYNIVCGLYYSKFNKSKKEWSELKFLKLIMYSRVISIIIFYTFFGISADFRNKFFKPDVLDLIHYSTFSKVILRYSINFLNFCGFLLIIIQYVRRKEITKFVKAIESFTLSDQSQVELRKKCIFDVTLNTVIVAGSIVFRNLRIFRNDYLPVIIVWIVSCQTYFIILSLLNFFSNFNQFIVIALRDTQKNLRDVVWNVKKLEESLINLVKIENFVEEFEKNFGLQLTTVTVNYTILIITFVSLENYNKDSKFEFNFQ